MLPKKTGLILFMKPPRMIPVLVWLISDCCSRDYLIQQPTRLMLVIVQQHRASNKLSRANTGL